MDDIDKMVLSMMVHVRREYMPSEARAALEIAAFTLLRLRDERDALLRELEDEREDYDMLADKLYDAVMG